MPVQGQIDLQRRVLSNKFVRGQGALGITTNVWECADTSRNSKTLLLKVYGQHSLFRLQSAKNMSYNVNKTPDVI